MKQFKKPLLRIEHENVHGEKMVLVLDENKEAWFYHEDCCEDFEPLSKAKYILSEEEKVIVDSFAAMTITVNKARKQTRGRKKK